MKSKLFVCLYSLFILVLFGVFCYLMANVNPPKIPQIESINPERKYMYEGDSRLPHDNPNYGLEKIPKGVDADEFRKNLLTRVTKYGLRTEQIPYVSGKRVVPPIWPSDDVEKNVEKPKINESNSKIFGTSLPIKGHRRSVKDNKLRDVIEAPVTILLKIGDDIKRKKIEIKFISGEKNSNDTYKEIATDYQNTQYKNKDSVDKVIQINADNVIILRVVDDLDPLEDKSELSRETSTHDIEIIVSNITNYDYVNRSSNNETISIDPKASTGKYELPTHKDMCTLSLQTNSGTRTLDGNGFSTLEPQSESFV